MSEDRHALEDAPEIEVPCREPGELMTLAAAPRDGEPWIMVRVYDAPVVVRASDLRRVLDLVSPPEGG